MGCSSCGGGSAVSGGGTSHRVAGVKNEPVRYVWRWTSANGQESQTFKGEDEARAWIKTGNPGTLTVIPA